MTKQILSFLLATLLASSSITITSCDLQGKVDQLDKAAREIVQQALNALGDAVRQGTASVGNIEIILRDAIDKLGEGGDQFVRGELQSMLARALASVGVEVRCGGQFIADQTLRSLERLIDILSGNTPREVTSAPVICNLDPVAIDLSLKQPTLAIYGYDIRPDNLKVSLVNTDGNADVTKYLSVASGYQMTLNLGVNGVPISEKSQKIIFTWTEKGTGSEKELSSVPIIQVKTPLCKTRTQLVVPNPAVVQVSRLLSGPTGRSSAAARLYGPVRTIASVQLVPMGRNLFGVMSLTAYRSSQPYSGGIINSRSDMGTNVSQVASVEDGWEITAIGFLNDIVSFDYTTSIDHSTDILSGKDFVARAEIHQDRLTWGAVSSWSTTFVFNQLSLALQEDSSDGHCIPTKPVSRGLLVITGYPTNILDDGRGFYGTIVNGELPIQIGDGAMVESQVGSFARAFPFDKSRSMELHAPSFPLLGKGLYPKSWVGCTPTTPIGSPPNFCRLNAVTGKLNLVESGFELK